MVCPWAGDHEDDDDDDDDRECAIVLEAFAPPVASGGVVIEGTARHEQRIAIRFITVGPVLASRVAGDYSLWSATLSASQVNALPRGSGDIDAGEFDAGASDGGMLQVMSVPVTATDIYGCATSIDVVLRVDAGGQPDAGPG